MNLSVTEVISIPKIPAALASSTVKSLEPTSVAALIELPPTENQDLSDSLDELTRSYAKRFAAQVAPWWSEVR